MPRREMSRAADMIGAIRDIVRFVSNSAIYTRTLKHLKFHSTEIAIRSALSENANALSRKRLHAELSPYK